MTYPTYSVAIRTLGTSGDKYITELRSIKCQTILPEAIYVYIPHGYDIAPVADEIYIRCDKGMVHQRSLSFNEISSDYILFLDDDIYLPEDAVEKMFDAILANHADCISPAIYNNHRMPFAKKVSAAFFAGTLPSFKSSWAFEIRKDSHYSYCNSPSSVMPSQSASFACFLCDKEVFKKIHFEDERWIDYYKFSFGDDQLFFFKMYKYGYKLFVHFDTNIKHLDAQTSRVIDRSKIDYVSRFIRFVIWYRTIYETDYSIIRRLASVFAFDMDLLRAFAACIIYVFVGRIYALSNFFKANIDAYKFVHSSIYKSIPAFMAHK